MNGRKRALRIATGVLLLCALAAVAAVISRLAAARRAAGAPTGGSPQLPAAYPGIGNIEPRLIPIYSEAGSIESGLRRARCVAVGPDGSVYVGGDACIRVFDAAGVRRLEIALSAAPTCLAVAADGSTFAGFQEHVEAYGADGALAARWPPVAPNAHITSITVLEDNIYLADAAGRRVLRYDRSGRQRGQVKGFVVPSPYFDVAATPGGRLLVADPGRHRIVAYTPALQYESAWSKPGMTLEALSGCCNPAHIAVLPDGSVVTSEKGALRRVKVYTAGGEFVGLVAGGTEGLDVAADASGRVLVLDGARVRIFGRFPGTDK